MATDDEEHKCAICRTSMFTLFDDDFADVSSLLCGHTFHECCLRDMRVVAPHQPLKCPICRKTSDDMLRAQDLSLATELEVTSAVPAMAAAAAATAADGAAAAAPKTRRLPDR